MNRASDLGDFHWFWDQDLTQCNRLEFVVHAHTQMCASHAVRTLSSHVDLVNTHTHHTFIHT